MTMENRIAAVIKAHQDLEQRLFQFADRLYGPRDAARELGIDVDVLQAIMKQDRFREAWIRGSHERRKMLFDATIEAALDGKVSAIREARQMLDRNDPSRSRAPQGRPATGDAPPSKNAGMNFQEALRKARSS